MRGNPILKRHNFSSVFFPRSEMPFPSMTTNYVLYVLFPGQSDSEISALNVRQILSGVLLPPAKSCLLVLFARALHLILFLFMFFHVPLSMILLLKQESITAECWSPIDNEINDSRRLSCFNSKSVNIIIAHRIASITISEKIHMYIPLV